MFSHSVAAASLAANPALLGPGLCRQGSKVRHAYHK